MGLLTILISCQVALIAEPPTPSDSKLEFVVRVPKGTPADAGIYIVGGRPELGNWRAKGHLLTPRGDGSFVAFVELPIGTTLEYKITRGSWETVEKAAGGAEMANRRIEVMGNQRIEINVVAWADQFPASTPRSEAKVPPAPSRTGDIRTHERFRSKILDNERTIVVYLPPGYEKAKGERYPVLYMHDGQNLFDAATSFIGIEWQADETAERLIKSGRIRPIIIVGMYNNGERLSEYGPSFDKSRGAGGKGEDYARFVIEEVKPFIDRTYRTRPGREDTAVAGSSMGGLISLYMAAKHPEVFSMTGVISPALMWDDDRILKELAKDPSALKRVRVWLDMGTSEGSQIPTFATATDRARKLVAIMDKAGLKADRDYRYLEVPGGQHNEAAWQERFDQVLEFLFPAGPNVRTPKASSRAN